MHGQPPYGIWDLAVTTTHCINCNVKHLMHRPYTVPDALSEHSMFLMHCLYTVPDALLFLYTVSDASPVHSF